MDLKEHILDRMDVGFIQHNDRDLVDCWKMGYYFIYLQDHKILLSEKEISMMKRVLGVVKYLINLDGQLEDKIAFADFISHW